MGSGSVKFGAVEFGGDELVANTDDDKHIKKKMKKGGLRKEEVQTD